MLPFWGNAHFGEFLQEGSFSKKGWNLTQTKQVLKLEKGLQYEIMGENGGFVRKHAHILNQREIPHHFDHSNVSNSENLGNLNGNLSAGKLL